MIEVCVGPVPIRDSPSGTFDENTPELFFGELEILSVRSHTRGHVGK
jgi:hypothetical protein